MSRNSAVPRVVPIFAIAFLLARTTGADAPVGRYTIAGDTVADSKTLLSWKRVPSTAISYTSTAGYCSGLGNSWRVPTAKELVTIADLSLIGPAIDPSAFPGTTSEIYWTSTPVFGTSDTVWGINQNSGTTNFVSMSESHLVRCVMTTSK